MIHKIALFLLLSSTAVNAQNLVSNGLFEDNSFKRPIHKPYKNTKRKFVKNWKVLNGKPDYFNSYKSTYLGFPIINSIDRGGKVGIEMYNKENKVEGIYTRLSTPLEANKTYKISFSVAHCQYSDFVVKQFPFVLSKHKISEFDIRNNEQLELQVIQLDTHVNYQNKWVKVSGIYEAKGGEEFLTLTNTRFRFTKKQHISRILYKDAPDILNKEMNHAAYYFFDNVELIPIDDSSSYCQNTEFLPRNNREKSARDKLAELKEKGHINENSPEEFKEFKDYTHHIFLFDISSSMLNNLSQAKQMYNRATQNLPKNDLVTGIIFTSNSQYLFKREPNSSKISQIVNNLSADGGTSLQTGLELVNKSIRADEKTKFYLNTDIGYKTSYSYMSQYVFLRLKFVKNESMTSFYTYPQFNEKTDSITFGNVYNEVALKHLPNKIPGLRLFESKLSREIREMMDDPNINEEKSKLFFIKDCIFSDKKNKSIDYTTHSTNYVFLVDASSSMRQKGKYDLLKKELLSFNDKLEPQDRISLISFSSRTNLLLDRIKSDEKKKLRRELNKLSLSGSTNIDKGLTYVYNYYNEHETDQNINLVLLTDGQFTISRHVKRHIKSDKLIHLQVFQFGTKTNEELEKLAKNSSLNYVKIDNNNNNKSTKFNIKEFEQNDAERNIYSDKIFWRTLLSKTYSSSSKPAKQFDSID